MRNLGPRKNCEPQTKHLFFSFLQFALGLSQLAIWMEKLYFIFSVCVDVMQQLLQLLIFFFCA